MSKKFPFELGKEVSPFLVLLYTISFVSTLFLFNFATIANIPSATGASILFLFALIAPLAILPAFGLKKITDFEAKDWTTSSFWLTVGFLITTGIGLLKSNFSPFSIFSIPQNQALATATATAPSLFQWIQTNLNAPIAEEILFGGLFIAMIGFLNEFTILKLNKNITRGINFWVASIVTAFIFAIFHIGALSVKSFLISAIIFRMVIIAIEFLDDTFKGKFTVFANVTLSMAIGLHIGNNISVYGLGASYSLLRSTIVGNLILGLGIVIFIGFLIEVKNKIGK